MMYFIKFLGIGAIATMIQYIIFIAFVELTSIKIVVASALGYGISSIFNYIMNYHYTFLSDAKHQIAAVKFTIVAFVGLSLNSLLMYVLVELLSMHYIISQILVMAKSHSCKKSVLTMEYCFYNSLANSISIKST